MDEDPLMLDAETMRRMGHRVVDLLADWAADPRATPVVRGASRDEMKGRLSEAPPERPRDLGEILDRLRVDVLPYMNRGDHPGYFAYIPGCGTWPGALGDFIASACNIYAGSFLEAAGPAQLELVVLGWFKEWIGYPQGASGILVSGGSAANMTALACAREALVGAMREDVVAYVSDQAHSSLARAARVVGFRPDQVRVLPTDERYRMRPDALAGAMDADARSGRRPLFVAAAAGSTNTGAVDPLPVLADVARSHGAWFHVDAAYGGFAALTERGRAWLAGVEGADSVTLDPHKWLYQPYECGCLLVRDGPRLLRAFEITPDYLRDAHSELAEVNFTDLGIQLTRMCRAMKVWLSVQYFGVDAFRRAIDRSIDLALLAQDRIEGSDRLELMNPASLGVVCFRRRFDGVDDEDELEALAGELVRGLATTGRGFVSSTRLRGRSTLRLCVLNHTSTAGDVEWVLDWLERATVTLPGAAGRQVPSDLAAYDRNPDVADGWLGRPTGAPDDLRSIPLFAALTDEEAQSLLTAARQVVLPSGTPIVERWGEGRDFYVILEGSVQVRREDEVADVLGQGEFFGELAALDWGAGFGYARLASVVAVSDVRLLVVAPAAFQRLVRDAPSVGDQVRRAVRDRLARP
jgi:aromatic-L-amino-acid decarboxylase